MKLASYKGTHAGIKGIGNILIRFRLGGIYSHSEVVFMPGDGVDHLMPDHTCEPVDGMYWCASSTGTDVLPDWSPRRAGKLGGVRFKRINLNTDNWDVIEYHHNPVFAANWFRNHQGALYDWQTIAKGIAWFMSDKANRFMCSESCAIAAGYEDAYRFDPCLLHTISKNSN